MRQRMICDSYCFVLYAMLYAYTIRGIIHLDWSFDVSISSVMPLVACVIAIYLTSITTIGISTIMLLYCPRVIAFIYVVILPIIIESVLCTELKETLQNTILGKESYGLYTFLMLATLTVLHILFYITYFMHKVKILRTFVKGVILEYVSNFKILFKLFTTIFFKVALFIFINNLVDKNIAKTDIDNIITIFLSVWSFSSLIYTLNLLAIIIAENHKEKRHILYKASSATFAGLGTAYFAGLIYPLRLIAIVLKYRDTASANFALKMGLHINNGIVYIIDTITFSLYTRNNPFCIFYAHKNDANYYTSLRYSHDIYRKSKMKLSHFTFPLLTFFTPICIFIVILALRMLNNLTYLSTYMLAVITTMIFGLYLFIIFVEAINVCKIFGNATYTTEAINEIANKSVKVEIL